MPKDEQHSQVQHASRGSAVIVKGVLYVSLRLCSRHERPRSAADRGRKRRRTLTFSWKKGGRRMHLMTRL